MNKRYWLISQRNSKGFTQCIVARKCNISREYYTMIELGSRNPSPSVAQRVAEALEFDWTIFFEDKSNVTLLKSV